MYTAGKPPARRIHSMGLRAAGWRAKLAGDQDPLSDAQPQLSYLRLAARQRHRHLPPIAAEVDGAAIQRPEANAGLIRLVANKRAQRRWPRRIWSG